VRVIHRVLELVPRLFLVTRSQINTNIWV
jgi:hypothetical protein